MMVMSQSLAPLRGPRRSASRYGLKRKMTMAVAVIQAAITAIAAQAGHQSIRPADQNRATPMTTSPRVSRMAYRAISFVSICLHIARMAANGAADGSAATNAARGSSRLHAGEAQMNRRAMPLSFGITMARKRASLHSRDSAAETRNSNQASDER